MDSSIEFDAVRLIEKKENEICRAVESALGISAKITLVSPNTIERSEGKAKRVIDKRKIFNIN
jgi:phenylacetate-CoA ligase